MSEMPSARKEREVTVDIQPSATGTNPSERADGAAMTGTGRPIALFAIKAVHTVIFASMS